MKKSVELLVVDDDDSFRSLFRETFKDSQFWLSEAANGDEALALIKRKRFDVGLLDIILPGMSGMDLLKEIKSLQPGVKIVMLTGKGSVQDAVDAIKIGAIDYLVKPFSLLELEKKLSGIYQGGEDTLLGSGKSGRVVGVPRRIRTPRVEITGISKEIREIRELIPKIADSDSSVIIQGESGTGKDIVANAIHQSSRRRDGPFIAINCGALSEGLLENELFGHEKGAFTDASAQRRGLFEVASGGTMFMDEIGELSPSLQVKFLRVLESGEFRRVGGTDLIKVDTRIIAATSRDFREDIERGLFRKDLYYRLNVIAIMMPSLRQRRDDIPLLVDHFLGSSRAERVSSIRKAVDPGVMEALVDYNWPGNIRELYNVLERALVLSSGQTITKGNLPLFVSEGKQGRVLFESTGGLRSLRDVEKDHIKQVLASLNNNKNKAAKVLKISRQRLYRKIEQYGLGSRSKGSDHEG